uniref:Uncharacterized protein n=1 Tax=viral metagenome TaxID=1070528 RepID=A0A6C0AFZ1_9ZZZZ
MITSNDDFLNNKKKISQNLCDYVYFVSKWEKNILKQNNNLFKFVENVSKILYLLDAIIFMCSNNDDYYGPDPFDEYIMSHGDDNEESKSFSYFTEKLNNLFSKKFIKESQNILFDPKKSKYPFRIEGGSGSLFNYDDLQMTERKPLYQLFIDKITESNLDNCIKEKDILCNILMKLLIDPYYLLTLSNLKKSIKKSIKNRAYIIKYLINNDENFLKIINLYFNWEQIEGIKYEKNMSLTFKNIQFLKFECNKL